MNPDSEYQDLINFFSGRDLPTGPQHINEFSVFFNLSSAVSNRLNQLNSDVAATRKSAALMLTEVKHWLQNQG
ncbi:MULTISPECIES: hypothetical protein [unclassified Spirosoma]|uniref:DUF6965 family protein n=1 Tax=unclassified Spirosoma TaxID=2621999 RepID=UPI00095C1882|nr:MULTISPECIES: hypothetical protein [unclassified Spirosoma]MBN8825929.1 hypothetical protein [Spirosoma sp.]OJW70967.1 MAG: hypothetical protein BGO59_32630 [Spirosoma sp. 48-14]